MTKYKNYNTQDPRLSNFDFWYRANADLISEATTVHKFGRNAAVGTSFVPVAIGGTYPTPTVATALEVLSASVEDDTGGSGARAIKIQGPNASWDEITQEVVLDGQTPVAIPIPLMRNYRNWISSSNGYATVGTGSHAGAITIRVASGGATWSTMDATDYAKGQSEISFYTVPLGWTAFLENFFINVDSNRSANVLLMQRPNANDVVAPYSGAMRLVFNVGVFTGERKASFKSPIGPFVGPCDIGFIAKVEANTGEIDADFELNMFKFT